MIQSVSFAVDGRELAGILHLPEGEPAGGAVVLHGYGGHPDQPHVVATCVALAAVGVAALRFAYRDHEPPRMTLESGLADTAAALRLLAAHPAARQPFGVVGFSFGGAVAALAAGRDHRLRWAVLAAAPAEFAGLRRPLVEVSRARADVLLIWGDRDTVVPVTNAERYATVLTQARVRHERASIEGGDHDFAPAASREAMTAAIAAFARRSLGR